MSAPAAAPAPTWPEGLGAHTPMPYALWRVLDLVDGRRPAAEIARTLGTTPAEVLGRLEEARAWVGRAARRSQAVGDDAARDIARCLAAAVGPVAALMVDEVRDELGAGASLSALLGHLGRQLSPERAQLFARALSERGLT